MASRLNTKRSLTRILSTESMLSTIFIHRIRSVMQRIHFHQRPLPTKSPIYLLQNNSTLSACCWKKKSPCSHSHTVVAKRMDRLREKSCVRVSNDGIFVSSVYSRASRYACPDLDFQGIQTFKPQQMSQELLDCGLFRSHGLVRRMGEP